MSDPKYEYIVVGSGAGGGTVAARLAEAGMRVLLLEAGGDPHNLTGAVRWDEQRVSLPDDYDVPVFHGISTESDTIRWDFWVRHYSDNAQQEKDPKHRKINGEPRILYPRAGALGGCTAHNAMIMVYPHNQDWDDLADLTGDPSWKAENMRKYFERMENCYYRRFPWRWIYKLFGFNPTRHGYRGWLSTQVAVPLRALKKDKSLVRIILKSARAAAKTARMPFQRVWWFLLGRLDPNDWRLVQKDAVGIRLPPLATSRRRRVGTREFLLDIQDRYPGNLTIELDALATKVLFDDKNRAIGVEYLKGESLYQAHAKPSAQPGEKKCARASREVILAGGAFNTPQLLMLSGIGPKDELKKHGIDVRVDLPGVGENLQDRYEVGVVNRMKQDWKVLKDARFARGDPQFLEWEHLRSGVYTTNGAVLAVIKKSHESRPLPDLFCFALVGKFRGYEPNYSQEVTLHHDYLTWAVLKAHTENRAGTVKLTSDNPREMPEINFHYFDDLKGAEWWREDLYAVVNGVEFVLGTTARCQSLIAEQETPRPGEDLAQFVKDNAWGHHASCTCKIGTKEDPMAVLDSNFRVYGTKDLRVVDASVFPRIPGFFIVTSVYMIGEKAADVILADAGFSPPESQWKKWWRKVKQRLGQIWKWAWRTSAIALLLLALVVAFSWFVFEPRSVPKNEAETIKRIVALLSAKDHYEGGPQEAPGTHSKTNACVLAEFIVEDHLWEKFKVGVFKGRTVADRTFQGWIRFSNAADYPTPDTAKDFRAMAIKLLRVQGEKLAIPSPEYAGPGPDDDDEKLTQDFVFIGHDAFFAGNPEHLFDRLKAVLRGGSNKPNNLPVIWHLITHPRGTWNSLMGRKVYPSLADIRWFSATPYKLGELEVKYAAFPSEPLQFHPPTVDRASDDYLLSRLRDQLDPAWPGAGLALDFQVQIRSKESQPIENALIPWDEKDSPWEKLATIHIPPQNFASTEQAEFCQNLTFNPWHSLPEHEPLGGINRVRRDVMFALQKARLDADGLKRFEPTGDEYFYPGATFPWRKPPPKK